MLVVSCSREEFCWKDAGDITPQERIGEKGYRWSHAQKKNLPERMTPVSRPREEFAERDDAHVTPKERIDEKGCLSFQPKAKNRRKEG